MIITSLLDTDLYKFTMQQVVLHRFPGTHVEYTFKCRNRDIDLRPFKVRIQDEIDNLCSLKFKETDLNYLNSLSFIKDDYIDFLRHFQLYPKFVKVSCNENLEVTIQGPWLDTILFETPLLAIISEVYNEQFQDNFKIGSEKIHNKIDFIHRECTDIDFKLAEFGTRRRFSKNLHELVIQALKTSKYFIGTSNVYFAMKYDLTPIGTMAHEFLQASQAKVRLIDSQKFALENWVQEYRGDLGIALTDVVGIDAFLRDFDLYFCKLFDGVRHDSGDPYIWGDKILNHYKKNRINAKTKTAVFSDSLDILKAIDLTRKFSDRIRVICAIGTNLTNDCGVKPLNIVLKMTKCDNRTVAKISDSDGKQMCNDDNYLKYLREVFKI